MRYFHFVGTCRYHYRENVWDISIIIPCDRYNKKGKETGKERKQKDATKTIMHSSSRPNHEGTRLMFASGTVSPTMSPADGQPKDDQKGPAGGKARRGQRQRAKTKRRPQQGGRVFVKVVFAWCFGVIRCHIAWYIAVDGDTISRIMWYNKLRYIEVSHPYRNFLGLIWRYRIPAKYFSIPITINIRHTK